MYRSIRIADISAFNSLISLAIATLVFRAGEVGVGVLDAMMQVVVDVDVVEVEDICAPFDGLNASSTFFLNPLLTAAMPFDPISGAIILFTT